MATEWRSRRWRKLLSFIDRLPRTSLYVEAVADDDEIADRLVDDETPSRGPRLSEWSPERDALADVVDMLGNVVAAVIAAAGVKPPQINRTRRPKTAFDRARQRQRVQRHHQLVARVLPTK